MKNNNAAVKVKGTLVITWGKISKWIEWVYAAYEQDAENQRNPWVFEHTWIVWRRNHSQFMLWFGYWGKGSVCVFKR